MDKPSDTPELNPDIASPQEELLGRVTIERRAFLRKLLIGAAASSAVAVPVVLSFTMSGSKTPDQRNKSGDLKLATSAYPYGPTGTFPPSAVHSPYTSAPTTSLPAYVVNCFAACLTPP